MLMRQERERAMVRLLRRHIPGRNLSDVKCLEIGCGVGANIRHLIQLGVEPQNVKGNELLDYQAAVARQTLPQSVQIFEGDAMDLDDVIAPASLDFVYQSVMFSSILDAVFQHELARKMWRWVRPGGGILWYDFIYDSPGNSDVRGVPMKRVREFFPDAEFDTLRVTLAPPIGRRIARFGQIAYLTLNALPLLRTHVICWIGKPHSSRL